ncbi:MAG TPA: DsbA family protein [Polyangiaceae bacterium]|nr:DsbA family protein [Polyangiaceae bacterium]
MSAVLRLYTDFVCPFCYIAERSTVPRLVKEFGLTLEWHGFELHPTTPRGGKPLSALFPGADLDALHARTRAFAATFGVTDFDPPKWLSNTRRALAAAEYARAQGQLEAFRQAAFLANFRDGLDLEQEDTLRVIARAAGLDESATVSASDDPTYLDLIDHKQSQAKKAGVTGIPTFVLGNHRAVGCQPYERLVAFVHAALSDNR